MKSRAQEHADYIISVMYSWERDYAHPLIRTFNIIGTDEALKAEILAEINTSDNPADIKYAATKLFKLHDVIDYTRNMQTQYSLLLETLQDSDLKLEHASKMFGMYCNKSGIRHPSQNNLLLTTFSSTQSSPAWRRTVATLQEHCFGKLQNELNALESPEDKLALLKKAEDSMHIFFWKEPNTLFSDATGTEKYRTWIHGEIEKLQSNKTSELTRPQ